MLDYSDEELERFLSETESDLVERKESWQGDAPEKGRQAVCGFANDLPAHGRPGVLIVGARDDGAPSGLDITDELLLTLADIKTGGLLLPPPSLAVEKRMLNGAWMAVVTVQPSDAPPVRYKGRIWVRVGPRRGWATAQDERMLSERRRARDLPFDLQPLPSCPLTELSRARFEEEYLPNAFAPDVISANERTFEERLAACRMIKSAEDPVPTVLGLLVLGISPRDLLPGAYVQFLRVGGMTLADPIQDEAVLDGPLAQVLRRLDEKLESHNRTTVNLHSAALERRMSFLPQVALQQLSRNAIMHRTYEHTNAPVRIYWFDDRVEIHNPGGAFGIVTAANFGQPGITDYRNPHLAEAMKVLGFVQRFGVGIATARREMKRAGLPPPRFEVQPTTTLAVLCARS